MGLLLLLSDYWLVNEAFPEYCPLVGPFEAFLNHHTRHTDRSAAHYPALMVEIRHDYGKALIFLSEKVVQRDFNVVKSDERGACSRRVGCFDLL